MNKPQIVITVEPDGNVGLTSNITDQVQVRNLLKLAEEMIVSSALKKASEQPRVIPAFTMPIGGNGGANKMIGNS